jgi:pyruvate,orthophosphate dikinase
MSDLAVLRLVGLKGRVLAPSIAESLQEDPAVVAGVATRLIDEGWCVETKAGLKLGPEGRARVAELVAAERAGLDQATRSRVSELYEHFSGVNNDLKAVITAWQMRDETTPNDHGDPDYDRGVVDRLNDVHERAVPIVDGFAQAVPRLAHYPVRLANARDRASAGDSSFVARPIADSYHTVWFELHEDLIGLAGLNRAEEAAAGRA